MKSLSPMALQCPSRTLLIKANTKATDKVEMFTGSISKTGQRRVHLDLRSNKLIIGIVHFFGFHMYPSFYIQTSI